MLSEITWNASVFKNVNYNSKLKVELLEIKSNIQGLWLFIVTLQMLQCTFKICIILSTYIKHMTIYDFWGNALTFIHMLAK